METLQRTANRGSISTGYDIDNSLKLEIDNNEWIYRSSPTAGNRKTFTISLWLKRACLGHTPAGGDEYLAGQGSNARYHFANDTVRFMFESNSTELESTRVLRDSSAWYHIVLAVDTTQGTAADRVKLYINGEQEAWNNTEYPSLNQESDWMNTQNLYIGTRYAGDGDNDLAGYISEVVVLDGTQASPTDLGEYDEDSGIWKPKDLSGLTFGSEGFYYKFDNAGSLGEDSSGNGNDATLNNITSANQATDTPTNNFCTINALVDNGFAIWSLTEGGTRGPDTNEGNTSVGTFAVSKGKWYWEGVTTAATGLNYWKWGITRVDMQQGFSDDPGTGSAWYSAEDTFLTQTGVASESPAYDTGITSYTVGDIWSISLNCDVNPYEITLRFNNSVPGTAANNTDRSVGTFASADAVMPYFFLMSSSSDNTWHNFGNPFIVTLSGGNTDENGYGDFKYAPPSGYYALCTKNLAEFG